MSVDEVVAIELSPSSGVPIYRQLIEQVRRMIASDQLQPGHTLPSVRQLATQLSVNPMTISKAYSLMEVEGLLERQRGKGMIVSRQQPESQPLVERLKLLQPAIEQLHTQAKQLDIDFETAVKQLKQQFEV